MNVTEGIDAPTTAPASADGSTGPPKRAPRALRGRLSDFGVVLFLLLVIAGFGAAEPGQFLTWDNAQSILNQQAIPAMLALAVIIPLAVGEFDLSVGATLGFSAIFTAYCTSRGMPVGLVLVLTLLVGLLIGVINAVLIAGIGVNAFIATLGVATVLSGGNLLVTNGTVIFEGVPDSLTQIAQTQVLGLQLVVFYCLVLALVLAFLLEKAPYGRYLRATGLGREAARLTGVRTTVWLSSAFVLAAVIASLAGFLQASRVGSVTPTIGPEFLLPAYAAAFLGATTIRPGLFNVWGTMIGVALLAVGITGLTVLGAPFWVTPVFNGLALVVGVSLAVLLGRGKRAA